MTPRVLSYTVKNTVRCVPVTVTGTVSTGTGTVLELPTRGIPVHNPRYRTCFELPISFEYVRNIFFLRDGDDLLCAIPDNLHSEDPADFAEICHVEGMFQGFFRTVDLVETVGCKDDIVDVDCNYANEVSVLIVL